MQIYETVALRYRPKIFDEVVGQNHITRQLKGMFAKHKLPRTILIHGSWGSGKTTIGRLIAKYANCQEPDGNGEPCGVCTSCVLIDTNGNHPCVMEINAGAENGIDMVRDLIQQAGFAPQYNFRVFILDEAHGLTTQAQRALLKILEEPPKRTIFVLLTTEQGKLNKAIKSRCIVFPIRPVSHEENVQLMRKVLDAEGEVELPDDLLMQISRAVQGHPRDALSALESAMQYAAGGDIENIADVISEIESDVLQASPYRLIQEYIYFALKGNVPKALNCVRSAGSLEFFMQLAISATKHVLLHKLAPRMADPSYEKMANNLKNVKAETVTAVLRKLVETQMQLKEYTVESRDLVDLVTIEICEIVR